MKKFYRFPMLTIIGALIALLVAIADGRAATITPTPNTIMIIYTPANGVPVYSPSFTISNADAGQFIAWCQAHYVASAAAGTALGCFNTWAADVVNQARQSSLQANQAAVAAAASAAATTFIAQPNQ